MDANSSTIFVSTIHKVKGKEFDNVFLLLENFIPDDDEKKRQLYVAVTRAKDNLSIHTNSAWIDSYLVNRTEYSLDRKEYPPLSEMTLMLSLRDIWLDDCARNQQAICRLCAGDELAVQNDMLLESGRNVAVRFSRKFKDRYCQLKSQGFVMYRSEVNFLIWWKGQDKPDEIFYVVNLSINPNVKIKPAKPEGDIQHGGLNYIAEVPDRLDNSFSENLEANKIRFNKIA